MTEIIYCEVDSSAIETGFPVRLSLKVGDQSIYVAEICPMEDWRNWSETQEAKHGLSLQYLISKGRDPYWVCMELNKELTGKVVHASATSIALINLLFQDVSLGQRFVIAEAPSNSDSFDLVLNG